jgi:hypothetical protein
MTQEFSIGQRVELAVGFDHLYNPFALVGAKGVVKDTRTMEGHPHIYIVWDKDDWRYNGMPDGWTYASHFKATHLYAAGKVDNESLIVEMVAKANADRLCPHCGEDHSNDRNAKYLEEAVKAEESIVGGDAFMVFTAKRIEDEGWDFNFFEGNLDDETGYELERFVSLAGLDMASTFIADPDDDDEEEEE